MSFPFPPSASQRGAQEITVKSTESSHCFDGLTPDTPYTATVYTQTPNMEGPGVSVKDRTRKKASIMLHCMLLNFHAICTHVFLCTLFLLHLVLEPTEAPTEPPPPPPPATVPPAMDGEESFPL